MQAHVTPKQEEKIMEREVVSMNGKTFIRIPKNLIKTLIIDKRYSNHLYFSSVNYIPFLKLWPYMLEEITDIEEFPGYIDSLDYSIWYYHHSKVKWWIETTAETYNEYYEISRVYPISTERYTTLVKRYCKWA